MSNSQYLLSLVRLRDFMFVDNFFLFSDENIPRDYKVFFFFFRFAQSFEVVYTLMCAFFDFKRRRKMFDRNRPLPPYQHFFIHSLHRNKQQQSEHKFHEENWWLFTFCCGFIFGKKIVAYQSTFFSIFFVVVLQYQHVCCFIFSVFRSLINLNCISPFRSTHSPQLTADNARFNHVSPSL
jgi:hypothetical protein